VKLRQLVYFNEVIDQDFNISAAAQALFTSQPGVSRQLQALADELGVDLFTHHGKRLVGLTEPGQEIAVLVARVIRDVQRIEEVADSHVNAERGGLVVVATRHAASNRLRDTLMRFCETMPALKVRVFEEEPGSASAMLRAGSADIGILSESPERDPELLYFPIETWRLLLVVPKDHALNRGTEVSLETIARYQICSYERTAHSRRIVEDAFRVAGMTAPIAHALGSSAPILQYVERGIGIGIVGEASFEQESHPNLRGIDVDHLFRSMTTDVVLPRKSRLRKSVCGFLDVLAPDLSCVMIANALAA
jgi:DNA-binding transcriptional LysR family regulator